jgi:serine/threonine-protein kinase
MKSILKNKFSKTMLFFLLLICYFTTTLANNTIIVSAEGLADPSSPAYQRDKGLLLDALRADARRQVVEKAVGTMIEGSTLVENYEMIHDRVLTKTAGLIKTVIKESPPWQGEDGFMHILLKAEVYITEIQDALKSMSKESRINLLKQYDNPKISVAILVQDANRASLVEPERSDVAENILKQHIKKFGYRVWSEENIQKLKMEMMERSSMQNMSDVTLSVSQIKAADFSILGVAKFKSISVSLKTSGITLTKFVLTSWTVKCIDNHTGEEIYFNNNIPRKKSWADEDAALADIGKLIGGEFSKDFFEQHLMAPSQIYQLQVVGLPAYDIAKIFKKELIGLRPVLNVDLRNFDSDGFSLYEVDFSGSRGNFQDLINGTVVSPLNTKLGARMFKLDNAQGKVVRVSFRSSDSIEQLLKKFNGMPPASLAQASPARLKGLIHDEKIMKKVAAINPDAIKQMANSGDTVASSALKAIDSF